MPGLTHLVFSFEAYLISLETLIEAMFKTMICLVWNGCLSLDEFQGAEGIFGYRICNKPLKKL